MTPPAPDRRRWLLLLAPVLATVLIAAVIGGFIVVQGQRQADQVEEADQVAADYLSAVGTFRAEAEAVVAKADVEQPAKLRSRLRAAVKDPPALPDVDGYGMEGSGAYQRAEQVEAELLEPYERLDASLAKAAVAFDWIEVARDALQLDPTDYVDGTTLTDSGQLRSSLIPAFQQARDRVADQKVPPGQKKLAAKVDGALGYVVDQASTLAQRIDANQNYSFGYADQINSARTAVEDYATKVSGDLTEQLNALGDLGDESSG